jgi:hypothetical protein
MCCMGMHGADGHEIARGVGCGGSVVSGRAGGSGAYIAHPRAGVWVLQYPPQAAVGARQQHRQWEGSPTGHNRLAGR